MTSSKCKYSFNAAIFCTLITTIILLGGCGDGVSEERFTPTIGEINNLTYTRPVDDLLPQLGNYVYTFDTNSLTYTETNSNTSGTFTYTPVTNTEATLVINKPSGTMTDSLTFSSKQAGTFVSVEGSDTVSGSFTVN